MSHRIYAEDAAWYELLTVPGDYQREAELYREALEEVAARPVRELLELGAGGGCNAFHLKRHFELTLVDLAPAMLELAGRRNPECELVQGDMRDLRLGREFDGVFVHDAITYMTTKDELRAAIETAYAHCRPGGAALFAPKFVRESFTPTTRHGGTDGRDGDGRSMRYLHWCTDPDPQDDTYTVLLTFVLREPDGSYRVETEEHINGFFPRATWTETLVEAGFLPPEFRTIEGATLISSRRPSEEPHSRENL